MGRIGGGLETSCRVGLSLAVKIIVSFYSRGELRSIPKFSEMLFRNAVEKV